MKNDEVAARGLETSVSDGARRSDQGAELAVQATRGRRTPLLLLALVLAAGGALVGTKLLHSSRQDTEDARVEGPVVGLSSRIEAQVLRVHVRDHQQVRAGDLLIELDPAEQLAKVELAKAELLGAQAAEDLTKLRSEAAPSPTSAVATAVASGRAELAMASAQRARAQALLKLAEAELAYTTIRAPRAGVVARRAVEEGQAVLPGRPLLAIASLDDVWVVANFKENQLGDIRPGQRARVTVDAFGSHVLSGKVESLGGGTGARFALLPPDNASGNFIKVVQRVPVLVRLDDTQGLELRPGMSAEVQVATDDESH